MAVLILDSEAISSLARPHVNAERHELVRAALRSAQRNNRPVRIPSATLVELYRGAGTDEPVDRLLSGGFLSVITCGSRIARLAGHLLAGIGAGSEFAIDALVVATAVRLGGGIVLTHDPGDISALAAQTPNVSVATI